MSSDLYLYFGSLGLRERQYQIPNFIGLALEPAHDRELRHDLRQPLNFPDNSAAKIQAQDVLEHLPLDLVPAVLTEVYRVLAPGGVFRLSVPDYRSPLLRKRSVYDSDGNVLADLMMGGSVAYEEHDKAATARFAEDGGAHLWFPTYERVLELVLKSEIRKASDIQFYQYFRNDRDFVVLDIPENEMLVKRSVPRDMRAGGAPVSIVVDFVK